MPLSCKSFSEMSADDYAAIGLRCGLEVHRQLLTRTKLFCRCPAGRYSYAYEAEVLRHMRPTLSELGEYDGTALMEKKTKKNIYYRLHPDTVCTYEFDDTPPFFLNDEALDIATELALLLRLNLIDELHIARKQYLDGSIPAGFQRTTILGVDGWIPYKDRRIGICQLGLEEDSCREVSDIGHDRVYLTDRLGMPLIEVVTAPDMHTPQETAEVGQIIRKLCRSTRKVRTGYGTVRQDVNVSVRGGTRIEIKGVPQLGRIPRLIYNEARRQCALLHIRDQLQARQVTAGSIQGQTKDVTRIVARTHYQPIRAAVDQGDRVRCVVLPGFAGLLNEPTQEHTTFAKEFSDRVRVIACLMRLPNMIHSDTASESLIGRDWKKLFKAMSAGHADALIVVWGPEEDARCACEEIAIRAREATVGVPSDTRQALKDGTNGFERVLPGAQRMYPDTDLPPLSLDEARVACVRAHLPEFVWDREARYRQMDLPPNLASALAVSPRAELFDRIVNDGHISAVFAATILCERWVALRRMGMEPQSLQDDEIYALFAAFREGRLARDGVAKVLSELLRRRSRQSELCPSVAELMASLPPYAADKEAAKQLVEQAMCAAQSLRFPSPSAKHRYLMGVLMHDLRGRVDGCRLSRLVTDQLDTTEEQSAKVSSTAKAAKAKRCGA